MKLNIDFDNKTISVTENVSFKTLVNTLKKMFPDTWQDFTLCASGTYNIYQPHYFWTEGWWRVNPYYISTPYISSTGGTINCTNLPNSCTTDTVVYNDGLNIATSCVPTSGYFQVELT